LCVEEAVKKRMQWWRAAVYAVEVRDNPWAVRQSIDVLLHVDDP
jgi:hypothetical protein